MSDCPHEWAQRNPAVRVCALCSRTEYDPVAPVHITTDQAAALGFARDGSGLLRARYWTFDDAAFRRFSDE